MSVYPEVSMAWSERILERSRVVLQHRIGAQLLQSMKLETLADQVTDNMFVRLSTELLREKVLTDTAEVPFTAHVSVDVPARPARRSAFLGFAGAIGMGLAGVITQRLGLEIGAVITALVGVGALSEPQDDMPTIAHVNGNVTVTADYFETFPKNDMALPEGYGSPVPVMSFQQPKDYDLEAWVDR